MARQVFRADRGRQVLLVFLCALFLALLGLTLAMLRWEHPASMREWGIFFGSLVLWTLMSCIGVAGVYLSTQVVTVDEEGIGKRLGGRATRVRWDDVLTMRSGSSDGSSWRITAAGCPAFKLEVTFLQGRDELKKLLRAKRDALPRVCEGEFRLEYRWWVVGFLAPISLALAGIAGWLLNDPAQQGQSLLAVTCLAVAAILQLSLASALSLRIRLSSDRIARTGLFGSRTLPLSHVQGVELKSNAETNEYSTTEWLILRGDGISIVVDSHFEEYATIRNCVLDRLPSAMVSDARPVRV